MKLRSSLSSAFYFGQLLLGYRDKGVRILCYHNINDSDQKYTTVSVFNFKAQMEFLHRHGYQTVSLNVIASDRRERSNLNGIASSAPRVLPTGQRCSPPCGTALQPPRNDDGMKKIVITFDDGYRDNYENAFLIMKKLGFKGTIFCIGEKIGQAGYLTKEEIREMAKSGFEFGSHTLSHRDLPTLHSTEKEREIKDSKSFLSNELELNADYFCYPRGLYDPESVELVKQAGYRAACSNAPGSNCISKNGKRKMSLSIYEENFLNTLAL